MSAKENHEGLPSGVYQTRCFAVPTAFFGQLADTCAGGGVRCGKIVFMTNTKYPRLSVRLSPLMKRRIEVSANSRHISQGRVIRDALKKHFIGSEFIDEEF